MPKKPASCGLLAFLVERRSERTPARRQSRRIERFKSYPPAETNRAIVWMRDHFRENCSVEDAAEVATMSRSAFHARFKAITMLRPVEFRTQLRLQQARRLMLSEDLDAASAGFEVGYSSPSQFSREYRRIFGVPRRSIRRNSAMCTFPIFSSRAALRRDPRQCIERCVKVGVMAGSCRDLGLAETFPYISRG
ncbi:hypothetical protein CO652_25860 [Rhizobium sp. H4]|nr:hypothetical protein CO652_25860 [Rhizobium sp. H4]